MIQTKFGARLYFWHLFCHSVHRGGLVPGGGCLVPRGIWSWGYLLQGDVSGPRGVCLVPGGCLLGWMCAGSWVGYLVTPGYPPGTATAAGGTHPTIMHSC